MKNKIIILVVILITFLLSRYVTKSSYEKGKKEGQEKVINYLGESMETCISPLVIYEVTEDGFDYLCSVDNPNYDKDENILWLGERDTRAN